MHLLPILLMFITAKFNINLISWFFNSRNLKMSFNLRNRNFLKLLDFSQRVLIFY